MPPHEHDAFRCLPMNTTTTLFLRSDPAMYTSPGRMFARVDIRDPPVCTHTWPYFLSCTLAVVRTCTCYVCASTTTLTRLYYDTCAPLHPPVYMYVHIRNQNDNTTYASTRWVPTFRHFLACEDVAGGSQQSRGNVFSRNIVARPVGPSCQVEESLFSA